MGPGPSSPRTPPAPGPGSFLAFLYTRPLFRLDARVSSPAALVLGNALDHYDAWPSPTVIVSDGAYGVSGFPGDPPTPEGLADWYAPHVAAWSRRALPSTTLWFWGTEIGWATVHLPSDNYISPATTTTSPHR